MPDGEPQGKSIPWAPVPDPTLLTTEQLVRAVAAERDFVVGQIAIIEERLRGMDRATELLEATVHCVPTEVQIAVEHLKELHEQRFDALDRALSVALTTAKESVASQDAANQKAISKAEENTSDRIAKQEQLYQVSHAALTSVVSNIGERLTVVESLATGASNTVAQGRQNIAVVISVIVALCTIISVAIIVVK